MGAAHTPSWRLAWVRAGLAAAAAAACSSKADALSVQVGPRLWREPTPPLAPSVASGSPLGWGHSKRQIPTHAVRVSARVPWRVLGRRCVFCGVVVLPCKYNLRGGNVRTTSRPLRTSQRPVPGTRGRESPELASSHTTTPIETTPYPLQYQKRHIPAAVAPHAP